MSGKFICGVKFDIIRTVKNNENTLYYWKYQVLLQCNKMALNCGAFLHHMAEKDPAAIRLQGFFLLKNCKFSEMAQDT